MRTQVFTFSHALDLMKQGKRVRRNCWSEDEVSIHILKVPSPVDNLPVNPLFLIQNKSEGYSVFSPSACEILAEDWEVVNE